jgi:hypothetical protein
MNRNYVLWNLQEATHDLARMVDEMKADADYLESDLLIAMHHVYHHLNTAWNARNASDERAKECNGWDFNQWRQFPRDIPMDA